MLRVGETDLLYVRVGALENRGTGLLLRELAEERERVLAEGVLMVLDIDML